MADEKENPSGEQAKAEIAENTAGTSESAYSNQPWRDRVDDDYFEAVTYHHKTIRRFAVGRFEFKNFRLVLTSARDVEEFETLLMNIPARDSNGIVRVDEEALADAVRPAVRSTAVRGATEASSILTAKDRQAIASGAQPTQTNTSGLLSAFQRANKP